MNSTKSKNTSNPCISICKTDPITGFCYGCARTNEEKKMWKEKSTAEKWKKENLNILIKRMSGWQLETFKESYKHKTDFGVSIYQRDSNKKPQN
jgi:hypothetical protein